MDEPTLQGLLEQARSYVAEGKLLHATQIYHRITMAAPHVDMAWIELSKAYVELRRFDVAERTLLQALKIASDPAEAQYLLGTLHLKTENFTPALEYFRNLLESEETLSRTLRAHLHFNTGLAHWGKENWTLSELHFRKVRELNPNFPRISESIAELLLRRGAVLEAIKVLKRGMLTEPYSWIGHYLLGIAFTRSKEWQKALDEFTTAIEMDPSEPRAWQMCGEVLITLQQLDQAEHYLRKALELNPTLADACADYGFVFLKRGDLRRANEYFEQALTIEPGNPKAQQGKRELRFEKKR
ncbi:MAG: tetratricopeptide repeat protein [Ignavibacteriales bacterium]|nr:tetratricopeptide repeat protein [Ignavibacteriales bacterium]